MVRLFTIVLLMLYGSVLSSQDTIRIKNSSFEDRPHKGGEYKYRKKFTKDWGYEKKPFESPPDIHGTFTNFWGVNKLPFHGETFAGMVAREDGGYEMIMQDLDKNLIAGKTYYFSIYLSFSLDYRSPTSRTVPDSVSFGNPLFFSLSGNQNGKKLELMAEAGPIDHEDWKEYKFTIKPKNDISRILIYAKNDYSKGAHYNGNLLLDKMSDIIEVLEE